MPARFLVAAALASTVVLGASGCSLFSVQATSYEYAPSDGVSVDAGDVKVRNALIVVNDSGTVFNLAMSTVNETEQPIELNIALVIDGQRSEKVVTVEPGLTQFGNPSRGQETIVFNDLKAKAGQTVAGYFQSGSSEERKQYVPVLDTTLAEYKPLALDN